MELPEGSKIHPVLHVSQLKKQIPSHSAVSEDLSSVCTDPTQDIRPEQVMGKRLIKRGARAVPQILVKWTELPEAMATWEGEGEIKSMKMKKIA